MVTHATEWFHVQLPSAVTQLLSPQTVAPLSSPSLPPEPALMLANRTVCTFSFRARASVILPFVYFPAFRHTVAGTY